MKNNEELVRDKGGWRECFMEEGLLTQTPQSTKRCSGTLLFILEFVVLEVKVGGFAHTKYMVCH